MLVRIGWAGPVARMGDRRVAYRVFVGKFDGKRPLGRPRSRWKDNIKLDQQELCWEAGTGVIGLRIRTGGGRL
jgi:hypothetical protein